MNTDMTIHEIESLDETTVRTMAVEALEIKGHAVYLADLGRWFGYSALVFADGRHIYHANDYALHHKGETRDELREWYVRTMHDKLFTEEELRTLCKDYSERQQKGDYIRNYYPQRREYQTIFCSPEDAADWYKSDKESAVYSDIAFAYFKPADAAFVAHLEGLYNAFVDCNDPLRDYERAKDAFKYEMFNHEYPINWQGDFDVISCFTSVKYKGDGTELDQTGWSDEIKRAYCDAAHEVRAAFNN